MTGHCQARRGLYGMSSAPGHGAVPDEATEDACQMRLVAHSTGQRDLAQRVVRGQQQALRQPHPLERDVGHRRLAEALLEGPGEVAGAETNKCRKIRHPDRCIQPRLDVRQETADLPGREPTLRTGGWTAGWGHVLAE